MPKIKKGFTRKDVWSLLSNGVNPHDITQETHRVLENVIPAETLPDWPEREYEMKVGCQMPQILLTRHRLLKVLICKHMLP